MRARYGWYAVEALTLRLFCYGPDADASSPGHGVLRFKCTRLSDGSAFELDWDTETGLCRSALRGAGWVHVHEMSCWMLGHGFGRVIFDVLKPILDTDELESEDSTFEYRRSVRHGLPLQLPLWLESETEIHDARCVGSVCRVDTG